MLLTYGGFLFLTLFYRNWLYKTTASVGYRIEEYLKGEIERSMEQNRG